MILLENTFWRWFLDHSCTTNPQRTVHYIGWQPSTNTDGPSSSTSGMASIWAIIRDEQGVFKSRPGC